MELEQLKPKITQFLYFCLIFSLFFPVRHVFNSDFATITGVYSDFTSYSIYLADFIIVALFLFNFRAVLANIRFHHVILALTTWILLTLIITGSYHSPFTLYFSIRFFELLILYILVVSDISFPKRPIIYWFSLFTGIESVLALIQFLGQKSLGLYLLGESHISQSIIGAAKIVSHGTKYIRAYGTFPHPNVFSAFLFTGILFSIYLLFISKTKIEKFVSSAILTLDVLALALSFSRAGIAVTALVLFFYLGCLILVKPSRKRLLWPVLSICLASFIAVAIFHQFIFSRATLSDQAVKDRFFYNHIGLNIIKSHPWQGIGFGTSMIHMQQFAQNQLMAWEIQPIHNYYVLAAAEIGIVGALILILLFSWHLFSLLKQIIKNRSNGAGEDEIYQLTLAAIFFGFLLLMLFDHYFYTTNQTQLLLWLVLGLIGLKISQHNTTYDTPSSQ